MQCSYSKYVAILYTTHYNMYCKHVRAKVSQTTVMRSPPASCVLDQLGLIYVSCNYVYAFSSSITRKDHICG